MIENKKIVSRIKIKKTKKIYINSFAFFINELIYINKLIIQITSLRNIYVIACFIVYIDVEKYRIKAIFDNKIKINYIFKRLANEV